MSHQEILYLVGIILTGILIAPLIWGLIWQIKMRKSNKRHNFQTVNQARGLKRYYSVFIFYLLIFALTADTLGFIILVALLVVK